MTNIRIITLDQTASTNSYLAALPIDNEADITVVRACHQTAGRGQGNNVWESEANKNLLFSFNIKTPKVPANQQFLLSMTCALAVKKALEAYIGDITLKWPNGIYKGDGKLGGILIETTIGQQGIKRCIFGVGININQRHFHSDAPNPVSLFQLTGHEIEPQQLLDEVLEAFTHYYKMLSSGAHHLIHSQYSATLYRREGVFPYRDSQGTFMAELIGVETDGHILLRDTQGSTRRYAFKEVAFVLPSPHPSTLSNT